MSSTPPPPSTEERRPRFQFSMATLMGTVTLIAVGLGLIVALPLWIGVLALSIAQVAFVAFLLAGALFAEGGRRTFCIGAIAIYLLRIYSPLIYVFMRATVHQYSSTYQGLIDIGLQIIASLFGGWICVLSRRYWERRST